MDLNESNFCTLMHSGVFVNERLLCKGIYMSSTPCIYKHGTTIDSIIKSAEYCNETANFDLFGSEWIENLKKCSVVDIVVLIKENT